MNSLGIDVDASDSDNMKNFTKMTVDTGVFTYDELVVWFETLSKLNNCRGMQHAQKHMRNDSSRKTDWMKAVTGLKQRRSTG